MDTANSLIQILEDKLDETGKKIVELKEEKKEKDEKVLEQLSLKDDQFYIEKLKLKPDEAKEFKENYTVTSNTYKKQGEFDYDQPDCTTDHIHISIHKEKNKDNWWVYIGEVKEGTDDTPHGIGIQVWYTGDIFEGYWKDGKLNGRGRTIYFDGDYYTGSYKEGFKNGQGTLYHEEHNYTGKWDGDYKGKGEINYKDGTKYTGQWDIYQRHGLGTLYSVDGQVLNEGKWEWEEYVGKE